MRRLIKPKAILFDWDNTLADSWPVIHASFVKTFEAMGIEPWSFEDTKRNVHRSLRDSFPELFGERWQEAGDIYLKYFREVHLDYVKPLQGAKEVLECLVGNDIYLSVVSNKTGVSLRKEVTKLGWDHYFTKIVGAKDAEKDKPAADPVHMALEGSGIEADRDIWFVGDSLTDIECAENVGCMSVFFGDQDLSEPRFEGRVPDIHFKDHDAFLAAVNDMLRV